MSKLNKTDIELIFEALDILYSDYDQGDGEWSEYLARIELVRLKLRRLLPRDLK